MSLRALSIAAAGGRAYLAQLDAISANIANVNTVGYKRIRASFIDPIQTQRAFEPGKLQATQRELDLAIEGDGFFRVLVPDRGAAFTRAGNLRIDGEGNLTTADGWRVDPPVTLPPGVTRVVIDPSGLVQAFDPESPKDLEPVGQIEISRFTNPSGLASMGNSLFQATAASGEPTDGRPGEGLGLLRQGHLEGSNVDSVRELADLIQTQRAFEMTSRAMQAADEVLQSINSLRRKS